MLISGTSEKIQIVLGGSVASTQLPFTVNYNNYTSTVVTLVTNNGATNNTTPQDLVPSPSASQQNQMRYCSIINSDTASATVRIQIFDGVNTRIIFQSVLAPGKTLQYQLEKGWEVIDSQGNKETFDASSFTNSINGGWTYRPITVASQAALVTNTLYYATLCKADKPLTTFNIMYNVTTAAAATPTWAEMAIYSGQRFNGDSQLTFYRRGFTSTVTPWQSQGIKNTTITTTGITTGEQVILAYGYSGTLLQFRTYGLAASDISDSNTGSLGANVNFRPSLMPWTWLSSYNAQSFYINWQAT